MRFSEPSFWQSPSGAQLSLRHQPAEGAARGVVAINHGLAEHSARYGRFATALAARGYHVYAHDHRGHGQTRAADAPLGMFSTSDGGAKVLDDSAAIARLAKDSHPGLPMIVFGHSMGGLIAANMAEDNPGLADGLAIWNAHLNPGALGHVGRFLVGIERFFKGSDVPSRLAPSLTFDAWAKAIPIARTAFDWLSHDVAEVDAYVADPLCGFDASVSMWIDVLTFSLNGGRADRISRLPRTLPLHIRGGGQDPATDKGTAMRWLAERFGALGFGNVTLVVDPAMRHESLNEIDRDQATENFIAWCDRVTGS